MRIVDTFSISEESFVTLVGWLYGLCDVVKNTQESKVIVNAVSAIYGVS